MQVPSGRYLTLFDSVVLRAMHNAGFVRRSDEPFILKSGIPSHVYVFGREDLTESPPLMSLVGTKICQLLLNQPCTGQRHCLIGIPVAGGVLAVAGALMSNESADCGYYGPDVDCRTMREVKKGHGAHQTWVTGKPDLERHTYWLIDNVATDGQSKIEAAAKLAEDGYPARPPLLIWIDRQQGAVKRLQAAGFERIVVAYNLLDIAYAYGELGLWPKSTVKAVEGEIAAHQVG